MRFSMFLKDKHGDKCMGLWCLVFVMCVYRFVYAWMFYHMGLRFKMFSCEFVYDALVPSRHDFHSSAFDKPVIMNLI